MNKTSFFSKKPISCPVCGSSFHREEMLTGSGRLIAGNLTEELRRLYEVNKKFGEVNPLVSAGNSRGPRRAGPSPAR